MARVKLWWYLVTRIIATHWSRLVVAVRGAEPQVPHVEYTMSDNYFPGATESAKAVAVAVEASRREFANMKTPLLDQMQNYEGYDSTSPDIIVYDESEAISRENAEKIIATLAPTPPVKLTVDGAEREGPVLFMVWAHVGDADRLIYAGPTGAKARDHYVQTKKLAGAVGGRLEDVRHDGAVRSQWGQ